MMRKQIVRVDQTLGGAYAAEAVLQDFIGRLEEIRESSNCDCCGNTDAESNVLTGAELTAAKRARQMILKALSTKH